jgi:hypothetical protein
MFSANATRFTACNLAIHGRIHPDSFDRLIEMLSRLRAIHPLFEDSDEDVAMAQIELRRAVDAGRGDRCTAGHDCARPRSFAGADPA